MIQSNQIQFHQSVRSLNGFLVMFTLSLSVGEATHLQAAVIFISDAKCHNICQVCMAEQLDADGVIVSAFWEEERQ